MGGIFFGQEQIWSSRSSLKDCVVYVRTLTLSLSNSQDLIVRTFKIFDEMNKRAKTGRPPFSKGACREARLFCRLLKSEVAEIEAAARSAKKTKSDWIRETLLTAARAKKTEPKA
jgi:hypothetical protein